MSTKEKIDELEKRIKELEGRPAQIIQYPVYVPSVPIVPYYVPQPQPWWQIPYWQQPTYPVYHPPYCLT